MSERLTDAEVVEIAELFDKSTPGVWEVITYQDREETLHYVGFNKYEDGTWNEDSTLLNPDDANFIAAAHSDIPRLLADRKLLTDHLAACEALLREIGAYCEPIAPGLDPVGLALYERIGPLLAGDE